MTGSSTNEFFVTIATPRGSTVKKVEGDVLSVGRAEDCNLRIDNLEVGRRHLSVLMINGRMCVEDHASTNGTFINGQRLEPHTAIPVTAKDQIHLGQSGIRLTVSTDVSAPSHSGESQVDTVGGSRIVTTTNEQRRALRELTPSPQPLHEVNESLLLETQRKASLLLQNAQLEAERKVQEIYHNAEEARFKSEQAYQRKLNQAFREAEDIYQKAQVEAGKIMDSARVKADEIRAQAEGFVSERRQRTEEDCERALEEAQKTARELKEHRLLEADEIIKAREDALLKETRNHMNERLKLFEADLEREAAKAREHLETELRDRRIQIERELAECQSQADTLRLQVHQLSIESEREKAALAEFEEKIQQHGSKITKLGHEHTKLSAQREVMIKAVDEANAQVAQLEGLQNSLKNQTEEAQKRLLNAHEEERTLGNRLQAAQVSFDTDLLKLKEQFENRKIKLEKDEHAHAEQLKLETTRHLQALEGEMYMEMRNKRARLSRELSLAIETQLQKSGDMSSIRGVVEKQLEELVIAHDKQSSAKPGGKNLKSMKRIQRWRLRLTGAVFGMALLGAGEYGWQILQSDSSPMQRRVAAAQEERQQELEKRKFNPPQTAELRPEYTDSVIYTQGFSALYLSDEFQKKLLQELSPYLLKTWRLDEDVAIQVLAVANSLVKELSEKKEAIHPDFVQKDVQKMHELEKQSVQRMTQILGSEVRYQSFRAFEKRFYEEHASAAN